MKVKGHPHCNSNTLVVTPIIIIERHTIALLTCSFSLHSTKRSHFVQVSKWTPDMFWPWKALCRWVPCKKLLCSHHHFDLFLDPGKRPLRARRLWTHYLMHGNARPCTPLEFPCACSEVAHESPEPSGKTKTSLREVNIVIAASLGTLRGFENIHYRLTVSLDQLYHSSSALFHELARGI